MFTVLIQNKPTLHSFYEHLPLFNELVKEGEMEICLWNEAGVTIEESLPDLHRLTDDKGRWKAVIVRYEDDTVMKSHLFHEDNPYDFVESDWNPQGVNSQNPLVRLCQQLSPPLLTSDRTRRQSAPLFDGIYPDSITIITVRHIDDLIGVAQASTSLEHGEFATRNGYPSSCRFAVVDRLYQGSARKIEDDFEFWTIVVMLARNRMDSSLMQAYQLYRVDCALDLQTMEQLWNQKNSQLLQGSGKIDHLLKYQSLYLEKNGSPYPDYHTQIESLSFLDGESLQTIASKDFVKSKSEPQEQAQQWLRLTEQIKRSIQANQENFPEQIRERLRQMHLRNGYQEDEVKILTPSQRERLEQEMQQLTLNMIDEESSLPKIHFEKGDELDLVKEEVEELLKNRLQPGQLAVWVAGFIFAGLLCMLAGWIAFAMNVRQDFFWLSMVTALLVISPVILKWVMKWKERRILRQEIEHWNRLIGTQYELLKEYMERYGNYLSDVLSYRNAKSYLEISDQKRANLKVLQRQLEVNQKLMQDFLSRLKTWAKAMRFALVEPEIKVDPESVMEAQALLEEHEQDALFTLEPNRYSSCQVNASGKTISSPFSFVEQLTITPIGRRNQL